MTFSHEKFKALVHYICWLCRENPSLLGSVKLNKILWLSDFSRYYATGDAITGARYLKRQFGPVPRAIMPVLRELEEGHAIIVKKVSFHGLSKTEYAVLSKPNLDVFTEEELKLVERMTKIVSEQYTAQSISDFSHDHIWHAAEDGEEIPYFTIFAMPGKLTDSDREWARLELEILAAA